MDWNIFMVKSSQIFSVDRSAKEREFYNDLKLIYSQTFNI